MSVDLLDKTRKINSLLRNNTTSKVAFTDLCKVLGEMLQSSVYVVSDKGKVLGVSLIRKDCVLTGFPASKGKKIDVKMAKRFLEVLSTKENVNLEILGVPQEEASNLQALITPVYIAGNRLGTLYLYREKSSYGIEDIILAEYSTTVVGLEMLRSVSEENDVETRKQRTVDSIVNILTPLERKAVSHVLTRVESGESTIITSRLAKEVGITRTVIVNALKKMESAGLVETKSYGVKGTHIRILNDIIYSEFDDSNNRNGILMTQREL